MLAEKTPTPKKYNFELPDTIIILFALTFFAAICTYLIPAGEYTMVLNKITGRKVADPQSFHYVAQQAASIMDMFNSIPQGLIESANIMTLTLMCGAVFHLVAVTGALDAGLGHAMKKLTGSKK